MNRHSRQFSPREEFRDWGNRCKFMLTVCQEAKKSRINPTGYNREHCQAQTCLKRLQQVVSAAKIYQIVSIASTSFSK